MSFRREFLAHLRRRWPSMLWLAVLSTGASLTVAATTSAPLWVYAVIGACIGLARA
jgi:hypothetical protein